MTALLQDRGQELVVRLVKDLLDVFREDAQKAL